MHDKGIDCDYGLLEDLRPLSEINLANRKHLKKRKEVNLVQKFDKFTEYDDE